MDRRSATVLSMGIVAALTTGFADAGDSDSESPTGGFNPSGTYSGTVKCNGVPSAYNFDSGRKNAATLVIDGPKGTARLCVGPRPQTRVGDYEFVWLPHRTEAKGTLGFMGEWDGGPSPLDEIGQGTIDWGSTHRRRRTVDLDSDHSGTVDLDSDSTLFGGAPPASASATCVWDMKKIATTTTGC